MFKRLRKSYEREFNFYFENKIKEFDKRMKNKIAEYDKEVEAIYPDGNVLFNIIKDILAQMYSIENKNAFLGEVEKEFKRIGLEIITTDDGKIKVVKIDAKLLEGKKLHEPKKKK